MRVALSATSVQVNRAHFPVTALGPGRRVGIWTQGCSIRCVGCISMDTWETTAARAIPVHALVEGLRPWLDQADGVTITGGEPFDQADALRALLPALRRSLAGGDILVFSGYSLEFLHTRHRALLHGMDALVSDPYLISAGSTLALRGSDNQRLTTFTPLGAARYAAANAPVRGHSLDAMRDEDTIWFAGIPGPGHMRDLKRASRTAGVEVVTTQERTRPAGGGLQ